MLKIKRSPCLRRPIESLLYQISVVGMNSLQYQLQCRLKLSIVFKDVVGFIRPEDFSIRNVHAESARLAYALPLSQESLAALKIRIAALQIRIEAGILERNRGFANPPTPHPA